MSFLVLDALMSILGEEKKCQDVMGLRSMANSSVGTQAQIISRFQGLEK